MIRKHFLVCCSAVKCGAIRQTFPSGSRRNFTRWRLCTFMPGFLFLFFCKWFICISSFAQKIWKAKLQNSTHKLITVLCIYSRIDNEWLHICLSGRKSWEYFWKTKIKGKLVRINFCQFIFFELFKRIFSYWHCFFYFSYGMLHDFCNLNFTLDCR